MTTKPKTVPELRFAKFDARWQTGRVDSFLVLQRGFDLTRKNSGEGTYPVYSSSGISYYHNEYKVRSPGIVTGRKGSVGPVFLVKENFWPHDTSLWVKDFKGNAVEFIYYFLIQFDLTRFNEASSVPTLNRNNVHREQSAIPTLPEQRKIADFLTAVDGRIQQLIQKKALLEEYKKGVMQQLFTQALRFKNDQGNEFPDWEEKKLGDVTKWSSGGTPAKDKPEYWEGDIPWMTAASMHGRHYDDSPLKISQEGLRNGSRMTQKGSILLLVRGSMLWNRIPVGIAIRDVAFNQDVKALAPSSEVLARFLLQWFIASENKLLHTVVGTGIGAGKLDTDEMKSMELLLPSLPEQTKIANFLTALDRKIESVAKQITQTQTFKKGLLQQMFV